MLRPDSGLRAHPPDHRAQREPIAPNGSDDPHGEGRVDPERGVAETVKAHGKQEGGVDSRVVRGALDLPLEPLHHAGVENGFEGPPVPAAREDDAPQRPAIHSAPGVEDLRAERIANSVRLLLQDLVADPVHVDDVEAPLGQKA